MSAEQIQRLNDLAPATGERHDEANMAAVDRGARHEAPPPRRLRDAGAWPSPHDPIYARVWYREVLTQLRVYR